MEVNIGGEKYVIKELTFLDSCEVGEIREKEGIRQGVKKQLILSGIPEDIIDSLTLKEGLEIQRKINDLNSTQDFQKPTE
jgi:hypothetical protein